jgi:hypothetical protein
LGHTPAWAQQSTEPLAAAAQNPVAAMISLPFQNNTFFGAGANHDKTANVLNIQPVLPFPVGDWNIISRTIAPLIALPSLTAADLGEVIAQLERPVRARRHQPDILFLAGGSDGLYLGCRPVCHVTDRNPKNPRAPHAQHRSRCCRAGDAKALGDRHIGAPALGRCRPKPTGQPDPVSALR